MIDDVAVFSVALDAKQAKEASGNIQDALAVQARGKLATAWGKLKTQ